MEYDVRWRTESNADYSPAYGEARVEAASPFSAYLMALPGLIRARFSDDSYIRGRERDTVKIGIKMAGYKYRNRETVLFDIPRPYGEEDAQGYPEIGMG